MAADSYLTTEQVAGLLGVTPSRVRQLVSAGRLRSEKPSPRLHLFLPEAVEEYRAAPQARKGRPRKG